MKDINDLIDQIEVEEQKIYRTGTDDKDYQSYKRHNKTRSAREQYRIARRAKQKRKQIIG